ncbi:hypothetical protein N2152v2_004371 [Parachlorella kessleri]
MGLFGPKVAANPRCAVALKEATDFLARLQRVEKDLRTLHKTADTTLAGCKDVMNAPLPHVYEETASASGGAVKSLESIGGPGFSPEQMLRYTVELNQAMQSQVFAPLQQWANSHKDAVLRQKNVDKLWAEVDARRTKVQGLKDNVDKLRGKGDAKSALKLEEATKTLQHKEAKLTLATARYEEEEAEQYAKLCVLIKDAVFLRAFIKTALAQIAQALSGASESMVTFLPEDPGQQAALSQQQAAVAVSGMPPQAPVQMALVHQNTMGGPGAGAGGGYPQGAAAMGPGGGPTMVAHQQSMVAHPQPGGVVRQPSQDVGAAQAWGPGGQMAAGAPPPGAGMGAYGRSFGRSPTMSAQQ